MLASFSSQHGESHFANHGNVRQLGLSSSRSKLKLINTKCTAAKLDLLEARLIGAV